MRFREVSRWWGAVAGPSCALVVYYYFLHKSKTEEATYDDVMIISTRQLAGEEEEKKQVEHDDSGPSWHSKLFRYLFYPTSSEYNENFENYLASSQKNNLLAILWTLHFSRRFVESLFIHKYETKEHILTPLFGTIFYSTMGYLNSRVSQKHSCEYLHKKVALFGTILFLMGEIGNGYHQYLLRSFQKESINTNEIHVMPHGALFEYISTPLYLFELITWFGWSILNAFDSPSLAFLISSCALLAPRAHFRHTINKQMFAAKWPKDRKALIPFVW